MDLLLCFRARRFAVLAAALATSLAHALSAQTLVIHVENIRAAQGSMRFGFYESAVQWKTEKSNFQRAGKKQVKPGGTQTFTYADIPAGHYAMALADDENDNGGMDWGLLLPKEGFGFSNYEHRGISRPDFEDFDFDLRAGEVTVVTVRVRYL